MSNIRLLFLSFIVLLALPSVLTASHDVAVDMEYECIGTCTMRVHLRAYRDCAGISGISNAISFTTTDPGCVNPIPLGPMSTGVITEVTPVCPGTATQCTSPAAPIMGVEEYYWFRDYDFCSSGSCNFTVSWDNCCRNGVITNIVAPSTHGMSISPMYASPDLLGSCNNSPQFTQIPFFFACAGQPLTVNQGAYDPDGDQLVFSLENCYNDVGTPLPYNTGYSATQPLGPSWSVSIDPISGNISLTPSPGNIEVAVICVKIQEYRGGSLIGTYFRDMQCSVVNCSPNSPPAISAIMNPTPNLTVTGSNIFTTLGSGPVCFDLSASDPDVGQTVTLSWDSNIPTGTFSDTTGTARYITNP